MHWEQIFHKLPPEENQEVAIDEAVEGIKKNGFHGLLLEMSLGKTKCSLNVAEILHKYNDIGRLLTICPKRIRSVWVDEIPKHTHIEAPPVMWENKKTKKKLKELESVFNSEFPILIVSLETFQNKNQRLQDFLSRYFEKPTLVVLDESSKIKNVSTNRAPRLIEYTRGAAAYTILTGTPWGESPLDIFTQMEFMQTGFWYRYNGDWKIATLRKHWYIFRSRYAVMQDIRTGEGRSFKQIVGTRRTEEIARKIAPYVTIQKKKEWRNFPSKVYQTLHVNMYPEQEKAYNTMRDTLILEHGDEVLTAANQAVLTGRLRQIAGGFFPGTSTPIADKIAGIEMLLEDVAEYPGKVIVAAVYVSEIEAIAEALTKMYGKEKVATYYGETADPDAEEKRFKEGEAKFIVLNPASAGYGLNLQVARLMYRYSLPYGHDPNVQLEDRIDRTEDAEGAVYKNIVHRGTVQEKPILAFKRKADKAEEFHQLTLKEYLTS